MKDKKGLSDYSLLGITDENNNIDSSIEYDVDGTLDTAFGKEYRDNHKKLKAFTPDFMANHILIEKLFKVILDECIKYETGDVQIVRVNQRMGYVRIKDGVDSKVIRILDPDSITGLVAHVKKLGGMSVGESNIPQDGRISYYYEPEQTSFNIRVNIIKDIFSEAIALRLLKDDNSSDDVSTLGLPEGVLKRLRRVLTQREGMILLTGATGSGKPLHSETLIPIYSTLKGDFLDYKKIKDLEVGDKVFDEKGLPTEVIGVYPQETRDKYYKLTFSDGTELTTTSGHEWSTSSKGMNIVVDDKGYKEDDLKFEGRDKYYVTNELLTVGIDDRVSLSVLKDELSESGYKYILKLLEDKKLVIDNKRELLKLSVLNSLLKGMRGDTKNVMHSGVLTTEDIKNTLMYEGLHGKEYNHRIRVNNIIEFKDDIDLKAHPYLYGLCLGLNETVDRYIVEETKLKELSTIIKSKDVIMDYNIVKNTRGNFEISCGSDYKLNLNDIKLELGILNGISETKTKGVPIEYKQSSVEDRLEIVKGLMDILGDINLEDNYLELKSVNKELINSIRYILNSLGIQSKVMIIKLIEGETEYILQYRTVVEMFNLRNKKIKQRDLNITEDDNYRYIIGCEEVSDVDTVCIEVDSTNHLYLCGETFIATHNTTTMYTALREIMRVTNNQRNIFTIEDPVEYVIPGITQVPVDEKAGRSYSEGIRALLRQNPDIVLIGEIRDKESAQTALRAATSGHLLLSTLHSNGALKVPVVLSRYGISKHEISSALQMILNQRLEKKMCSNCRIPRFAQPSDLDFLHEIGADSRVKFYDVNADGCIHCNHTGYKGKVLLVEMIDADRTFDEILNNTDKENELEKKLIESNTSSFYPMKSDVLRHLKEGNISVEVAMNIVRK